ncbi:MAG: InlB B-repeat-containing protein, partial [Kiritimatiellae bacterium]|nr:InlB B-repeat-containing protein [Kiritimatiellia bacterium]
TVTVNDGAVITATAQTQSHTTNNNGTSTVGYAIASVGNVGYQGEPTVTITGGTIAGQAVVLADQATADNGTITATSDSIEVPEGYRWYATATPGVYELAVFYTITWNFNNGADSLIEEIRDGEAVTAPADPVKEGYTFTGWTPAVVSTAVADATYTAVFEEDQAPVTDGIKIDTIIDAEVELDPTVDTKVVICTEKGTPTGGESSASGSDYVANDVSVAVGETKYFTVVQGVTTSAVYGVTSPNTTKKLNIVAVPFAAIGEDSTDVAIEKIIDTGKLNNGDKVYAYSESGDTYNVWRLYVVGTDKTWQPLSMVKVDDNSDASVITGVPFENARVARGSAFWVEIAPDNDSQIVLIGKVATAPAPKTITGGTALEPKFQLCASPKATAFNLNAAGAFTGYIEPTGANFAQPGDVIQLTVDSGAPIVFYYKNGQWGRRVDSTWKPGDPGKPVTWSTEATIPVGVGFWYISRGGNPTINW